MGHVCRTFRIAWLSGDQPSRPVGCQECAAWVRSAQRLYAGLRTAERKTAPAELQARVEEELAGNHERRLRGVLGSLLRHGAPAALDARVAEMLSDRAGDEQRGRLKAQAIRALDVQTAPGVLERLLQEELEAPERHRAERFSGNLERLNAPAALETRIKASLHRRLIVRLVLGPLVSLAAAGLIVWISVRGEDRPASGYRFRVIEASSLEGMDPMARAIAEVLGGGVGAGEVPR